MSYRVANLKRVRGIGYPIEDKIKPGSEGALARCVQLSELPLQLLSDPFGAF